MYMSAIPSSPCNNCAAVGMAGMGEIDPFSIAARLVTGAAAGGGGGGSPGAPAQPSVSVQTSTNISPQISPSFVQQQSPTNSPVSTGATQNLAPPYGGSLPGTMVTGAAPGFDVGSAYMPTTYPAPGTAMPVDRMPLYIGIAAIAGLALLLKKKRSA